MLSGFNVVSVVQDVDRKMLLDYMAGEGFMLRHELRTGRTLIITPDSDFDRINRSRIGMEVEKEVPEFYESDFWMVTAAVFNQEDDRRIPDNRLDSLYGMFLGLDCEVYVAFCPAAMDEVIRAKGDAEEKISRIETRRTHGTSYRESGRNMSTGTDLYYQFFERNLLQSILENLDEILASKGSSYKMAFAIRDNGSAERILGYLKANTLMVGQKIVHVKDLWGLYEAARRLSSIPLSHSNASRAFGFSARITRLSRVRTGSTLAGDIEIGRYLDSGISETEDRVSINRTVLNLGTLMTGLPGTGKTKLAQSIIEQAHSKGSVVVIISPTGEWNGFGQKNSLGVLDLGDSSCRMNLFRCETTDRRKFYEGLAMLIAAGCNPGPYRNSVEKCLVAAFSRAYSVCDNPDPAIVYDEIEEAIIEQHGKRIGTSVKYTKHGENTRAALESLRQLLMMPQFAYPEGVSFFETISGGVVFDLSGISNRAKPLVYAMILNQVYTLCEGFDLNGNDSTRMIICLEESQLIFNSEEETGASEDLGQRIQNFRKKGIGLFLITHNVTDIGAGVRRLCQNKFYFRQSADIAKYAANDLIFDERDYDRIISMLKTLSQRRCAINAVAIKGSKREVLDSLFAITDDYLCPDVMVTANKIQQPISTRIRVTNTAQVKGNKYMVLYLGEIVSQGIFNGKEIIENCLLKDRSYRLVICGEKKRDNREFKVVGGIDNNVVLNLDKDQGKI